MKFTPPLSPEWVLVSPLFINWLIYTKALSMLLGRTEQGAKFTIKLPLITAPKVSLAQAVEVATSLDKFAV